LHPSRAGESIRTPIYIAALLAGCSAAQPAPQTAATPDLAAAAPAAASQLDATAGLVRSARVAAVLAAIDPLRIRAYDSALVAFGTRHTMSDTSSTDRGIGAARRWLRATLDEFAAGCDGCLRVEYDTSTATISRHPDAPAVHIVNVLAWLDGRDTRRVIVMGAHYDSCVCADDPWDAVSDAPGADDDGSGTSAVLELARVLSEHLAGQLEATVVFALYAGEEQGLHGSAALARRLHADGYTVVAAMTDDIVGNVSTGGGRTDSTSVRIFAADPDNGGSRELARHAAALGRVYLPGFEVVPVWRLDRIGRGGDHIPFQLLGDPAIRFSERLEHYGRQHLPTDVFEGVNFGYVANVARLNAATIAEVALAPPAPDSLVARRDRESGGQQFAIRWSAVPGAAGYELVLRRTTAPMWEQVVPAGAATEYLLDAQLDDLWLGVRSVGAGGHRSPATVWPAPMETP
jgi:hypothetical protein